jgi:succinoglycan biosynthesis protein ExoM
MTAPGESVLHGPGRSSAEGDRPERIDVCICTYRRPSILPDAIESVARQALPPSVSVRIIVADNDDEPTARASILAAAERFGADLLYIHAPKANISIARNACIAAVETDWFAYIDDDETASPDWLADLLAAREGVDVVFGAVQAIYSEDAPKWMVEGDYHSNILTGEAAITTGYTSNVLIRRACIGDLRFDPGLGVVGGEDTVFFYALHLAGDRFTVAPVARVFEKVAPARENLAWILRRQFRAGQTHAHLTARFHPRRLPLTAALAAVKSLYSIIAALACAPFRTRRMRNFIRAVFHAGVVSYSLGGSFYREYETDARTGA